MFTMLNDTYEIKSVISKGETSTLYLAEHRRLRVQLAIKEIRKQPGVQVGFLAESNILKRLHHPMLPHIMDIFEDQDCIYIVKEHVQGVTLDEVLRRQGSVDEMQGLQWFRELCGVLKYLHGQRPYPIIYRDMKPSNIMLQEDGSLKLIDFGIAQEFKRDFCEDDTDTGISAYAAPEQFGGKTDPRTDIYALGATMYHLLTGKAPYEPPYYFAPARQLVPELSRGIENILSKCIQADPADRYQTVDKLIKDIEHINQYGNLLEKLQGIQWRKVAFAGALLLASIVLIAGGSVIMKRETIERENQEELSEQELPNTSNSQEPTEREDPVTQQEDIVVTIESQAELDALVYREDREFIVKVIGINAGIQDISALSSLSNLETLILHDNNIRDISALKNLGNLTELYLQNNAISDIDALGSLKQLTRIELFGNDIQDISALSGLSKLLYLYIGSNDFSDINILGRLTSLKVLSLTGNPVTQEQVDALQAQLPKCYISFKAEKEEVNNNTPVTPPTQTTKPSTPTTPKPEPEPVKTISVTVHSQAELNALARRTDVSQIISVEGVDADISDISALKNLTNLQSLNLSKNKISEIGALRNLKNLTSLDLQKNSISDISALSSLNKLKSLTLDHNDISDISALSGLTSLTMLSVQNNEVTDISALSELTNLAELHLERNKISRITALGELKNLKNLNLSDNSINDIEILGNLKKLKYLYLYRNKMSDKMVERLRLQIPDCYITY